MNTLHILNETFTNGYVPSSLDILTLIAIFAGISVIITKNPVVSVLCLIGLFVGIASYLIALGLNFLGLSYLLVYVGAVSILFLFILMLINVRISELLSETRNSIPLVFLISICFSLPVTQNMPYNESIANITDSNSILQGLFAFSKENVVYYSTSNTWDGNLLSNDHITSIGNIIYSSHNIWLIIVSIILLLAMVGAIVITIKYKDYSNSNLSGSRN